MKVRITARRISKLSSRDSGVSGILLYAKRPGLTSFASLGAVKKALETGKVGHTGTLDSFAEGLLVVLAGKMTRLVSHITAFDKTYQAVVQFGTETDTLDPCGAVVCTAPIPSVSDLQNVLSRFTGSVTQIPPLYSAIHIDGKRASDVARCGGSAEMPARDIVIHSLKLLDFDTGRALIEVTCSKGTYIRSLARDIARAAGSCAHVAALRRTAVGPFSLEDAVFAGTLAPFSVRSGVESSGNSCRESELPEIRQSLLDFTPETARICGFLPVMLRTESTSPYVNGQKLQSGWFCPYGSDVPVSVQTEDLAVFYGTGSFAGIVRNAGGALNYGFVVQPGDFHA